LNAIRARLDDVCPGWREEINGSPVGRVTFHIVMEDGRSECVTLFQSGEFRGTSTAEDDARDAAAIQAGRCPGCGRPLGDCECEL
jgi:hypothetical protein